jgi:biopolymer transport protein ExbD
MAFVGTKFKGGGEAGTAIPTASMADISFLLLVFFIVSTVFVRTRPTFQPTLPMAESVDALKNRRNIAHLWISPDGLIQIDSSLVALNSVAGVMLKKLQKNPQLIVLIKSDEKTRYGTVSNVIEELRKANAVRISFAAKSELQ